jgi:cell division protein FtsB
MSNGHKTSAIVRPKQAVRRVQSNDHTRLSDFTRPIEKTKQLVQRKGNRWLLALVALVVIAALLGALFVLPVQAWLRQEDDLAVKRDQLAVLDEANAQLETEVDRLEGADGAKEAARDELGLVAPGEIRISMLDVAQAPARLPAGFPYDAVTQIVATRTEQAQAAVIAATTVPATTAPGTTEPHATAPGTTEPLTTAPVASAPVATAPATTGPGSTAAP